MIILGLTGGLAMGKSTVAALFGKKGVPVHNADKAVHRLYEGEAVSSIAQAFPSAIIGRKVSRQHLSAALTSEEDWKRLNTIVHPLVQNDRAAFITRMKERGLRLIVLDVPLLFEAGQDALCDAICLATASPEIQKERAWARSGMSEDKFTTFIARQMPDMEKRRRVHFIVSTDVPLQVTERQIDGILKAYAGR